MTDIPFLENFFGRHVLTDSEMELIAMQLCKSQYKEIFDDGLKICLQYKNLHFLNSLDIQKWLEKRNRIILSFMFGISLDREFDMSDMTVSDVSFIGLCLEMIYRIRCQTFVLPLSFLRGM